MSAQVKSKIVEADDVEDLPDIDDDDIPAVDCTTATPSADRWATFCGRALNAFKFHKLEVKNSERMSKVSALFRVMHGHWDADAFEPEMRAILNSPLSLEDYLQARMGSEYVAPPPKKVPRAKGKTGTPGQRSKAIWAALAGDQRVATVRLSRRKPIFMQAIQTDLERLEKANHELSHADAYMAGVRSTAKSLFSRDDDSLL